MTTNRHTSQPVRLLYLVLYLLFLITINRLAFGQWLPLTTAKGLWFYCGAAALILGSLLVTPFFTSPANAISYLVAALIAVFAFPPVGIAWKDTAPRQFVIVFCFTMLALATVNIIFKDSRRSDHDAYWKHGIPAVMLTDTANFRNPHYHQPTDTPETLNYGFMKQVTMAVAATILEWAGIEGDG